MRTFSSSSIADICLAVIALLLAGCFTTGGAKYTKEDFPRADQKHWPDELQVVDVVVRCVRTAEYTSSRNYAVREYALFLRQTYGKCSEGGLDADAGMRALNYIKKIHNDAKGGKKLWKEAMELACYEPEEEYKRMPGLPPPSR